jgi:hypothetical protein
MAADSTGSTSVGEKPAAPANEDPGTAPTSRWGQWFRRAPRNGKEKANPANNSSDEEDNSMPKPEKWSLGILNDKDTDEVPGKNDSPFLVRQQRLTALPQVPFCSCPTPSSVTNPLAFVTLQRVRRRRLSPRHFFPPKSLLLFDVHPARRFPGRQRRNHGRRPRRNDLTVPALRGQA